MNDYTTVVTVRPHEPITLDELKQQENIPLTSTDHDAQLWSFIRAAREACEDYTGLHLVGETLDFPIDAFPAGRAIRLPAGKLQSITSLIYTDSDDTPTTWATANYFAHTSTSPGELVLWNDKSWPSVTLKPKGGIVIRCVIGVSTGDLVKDGHRAGMLRWAGNLWIYREATSIPEEGFDTARILWDLAGVVLSQGSQPGVRL